MAKPIDIKITQEISITVTDNSACITTKVTAVNETNNPIECANSHKLLNINNIKDYLTFIRSPLKDYVVEMIEDKTQ